MANIKISQLPTGLPNSDSIFPFVKDSVTYQGYISALTTSNLVEVTLTEFNDLCLNNEVLPGKKYLISNVDQPLYGGTNILVDGVTSNQASSVGQGIFYNPKYDQSEKDNGVWNKYIQLSVLNYTGTTFTVGETVISDLGGLAIFVGGELFEWVNGIWTNSNYITGQTSGTIAEITDSYFEQYSIGNKKIWGGKLWELTTSVINGEIIATGDGTTTYSGYTENTPIIPSSITIYGENEIYYDNGSGILVGGVGGTVDYDTGFWQIITTTATTIGYEITIDYTTSFVGNQIDKYNLSSIWSPVNYNEQDYELVIDEIKYDYENDLITFRKDSFGNEVDCTYESINYFNVNYGNPIKDFQWGNGQKNWGYGPSIFYFNDVSLTSDDIYDGGFGMYDNGNTLNTNLGQIPYTHTQMSSPPINPLEETSAAYFLYDGSISAGDSYLGAGSIYFTNLYPGMFVFGASNVSVDSFFIDGGVGADCASDIDSYTQTYTIGPNTFTAFVKRYFDYSTDKPSINHILIVNGDGVGVNHDYTSGGCDSDFDEISNLTASSVNTIYYLNFSQYPNQKIEDSLIDSIVNLFLELTFNQSFSNVLLTLNENFHTITDLLPKNQTSEQLGIMNNVIENSYFDCLNFIGGHIWSNRLDNYSIYYNNNFSPNRESFFSDNKLTNSSVFADNYITENSSVTELALNNGIISNNQFNGYLSQPSIFISCELINSYFSANTVYQSVLLDNVINNLSEFSSNYIFECSISSNTISNESKINNNNLVLSEISSNSLQENSTINDNILSDSNITNNELTYFSLIESNTILNNSNVRFNLLNNNSIINHNYLSGSCSIEYNKVEVGSTIEYNSGFTNSYLEYNNIFYSSISGNTLNNSGFIQENTLTQYSEITSNLVLNSSFISNNEMNNESYIVENFVLAGSEILENYLNSSYMQSNICSASTISKNTCSVLSGIFSNELSVSNIWINKIDLDSSIYNGIFDNSNLEYNSLKNTSLNLESSCLISNKVITKTNFSDSTVDDISENSTVIYETFPKEVFTNSTGITRISYYDASDTLVIGDINDSVLPTLYISAWTATSFYDIDVTVDITLDGGNSVTERGVVWALSGYPTVSDNVVVDGGTGTGSYTNSLTGLTSGATIYFRGYAVNSSGTGYTCQDEYVTSIE
jgi:hypothetical protein